MTGFKPVTPKEAKEILTTRQAIEFLGITKWQLLSRIKDGELEPVVNGPTIKVRGQKTYVFEREHLEETKAYWDSLAGHREIADWLGITGNQLKWWQSSHPLPEPEPITRRRKLWTWDTIEKWADKHIEWPE